MTWGQVPDTTSWAVHVPAGYRVGRWQVTMGIASGGWGSVYAARCVDPAGVGPTVPLEVALKFLPTGTVTSRQLAHVEDMARREIRVQEQLQHPHIVRTFEVLTVDDPGNEALDGCVVLVMERAIGTLRDVLDRAGGGAVPGAAQYIEQICVGLVHLHANGWVHGDLKPSNVLVAADGSVRLADFGLAAELDGTHGYLPPVGSPDYVPPERWTEELSERGTPIRTTADVWALGVTAHQLMTGQQPFAGGTAAARSASAAAYASGRGKLELDPSLPPEWQAWIEDCLSPDHRRRQPHLVASLLDRIRVITKSPARRRTSGRARRWLPVAAAFVVGATLAGTGAVAAPLSRYLREKGAVIDTPASAAEPTPSLSPSGEPTPSPSAASPSPSSAPSSSPSARPRAARPDKIPVPLAPPGTVPPPVTLPPLSPSAPPSEPPAPAGHHPVGKCEESHDGSVMTLPNNNGPYVAYWCTVLRKTDVWWNPLGADKTLLGYRDVGAWEFVCQIPYEQTSWGFTKAVGDSGWWGFVDLKDVSGGENGGLVRGLPDCEGITYYK